MLRVIQLNYWEEPVRTTPDGSLPPVVETPAPVRAVRRGDFVLERKGYGTNWIMVGVTNAPVGEFRVRRVR